MRKQVSNICDAGRGQKSGDPVQVFLRTILMVTDGVIAYLTEGRREQVEAQSAATPRKKAANTRRARRFLMGVTPSSTGGPAAARCICHCRHHATDGGDFRRRLSVIAPYPFQLAAGRMNCPTIRRCFIPVPAQASAVAAPLEHRFGRDGRCRRKVPAAVRQSGFAVQAPLGVAEREVQAAMR